MQALKDSFAESDLTIELYAEYLDTKRFPDRAYWSPMIDAFIIKYKTTPVDLIITSDNNALEFLFQYRHIFFPDVPVIFCGLNHFKPEMLEGQKRISGIAESTNLKGTLDLALELHSETEQLIFIASSARSVLLNLTQLEAIRPNLKSGLTITVWKDNTIEEIEARLHKLTSNSLVFILGRIRNLNGEYLNSVQMGQKVSAASPVPVYSLWNFYLGTGIVGGKLLNGNDQGRVAAEMALKILNGVPVSNVPIITDTPTSNMFDYSQLKRFGIALNNLPHGSILINRPYSFYETNKTIVWTTVIVFLILSALIIFLFLNVLRRRQVENELHEYHKNLELIIAERTKALRKSDRLLSSR